MFRSLVVRNNGLLKLATSNFTSTTGISNGFCKGLSQRTFHSSGFQNHSVSDDEIRKKVDAYLDKEVGPTIQGTSPELEDLMQNNKEWVEKMNKEDPEYFKRLGSGQSPRYLYIGCSDSRVDPGRVMGVDNGTFFVHRNVGNVVSGTDLNLLSVLEYSVGVLKVPHIIVCGHYDCGAVRGSTSQPDGGGLGLIENWLRNIRDVARLHKDELMAIDDQEQRHRRLVELNVMEQCLNIFKTACVQKRRVNTYVSDDNEFALPRVHGLVFDPADGSLTKLPLNFKAEIEEYRQIYDLYHVPEWVREKSKSAAGTSKAEFWEAKKPVE